MCLLLFQSPLNVTFREAQITQLFYSACPRVSPFPIIINHAPCISAVPVSLESALHPIKTNGRGMHTPCALPRALGTAGAGEGRGQRGGRGSGAALSAVLEPERGHGRSAPQAPRRAGHGLGSLPHTDLKKKKLLCKNINSYINTFI